MNRFDRPRLKVGQKVRIINTIPRGFDMLNDGVIAEVFEKKERWWRSRL